MRPRAASRSSRPVGNSRQGGFSLLELAVVMVILGLATAVAAPTFVGFYRGALLDQSARQLRGFLNRAQLEADRDRAPVRLRLEANWRALEIRVSARSDATGDPVFDRLERGGRHELPPGISLEAVLVDGVGLSPGGFYELELQPLFSRERLELVVSGADGDRAFVVREVGGARVVIR